MSTQQVGIDLRLLGQVRVRRDGAELVLGSARRTAVLCVLALHAGRRVSREQLVAAVWGDDPPPSATGNIYTYVSTLRQLLEPARGRWTGGRLLSSGDGGYQLHVPRDAVDALRFESLRGTARRHRSSGDGPAELAALASALRCWQGDALTGVPGPFADVQRQRLTGLRIATAERHADLLAETGHPEDALRALRELVAAYPDREDLGARLAAARPGGPEPERPAAAARAGRPAGVVTGADGTTRSGPAVDTGPGHRPERETLFGRDVAVRRLRRAVAGITDGRGGSLVIEGPAGVGRTALLTAALPGAGDRGGYRIGWAVGDEVADRTPLGTLLEGVESALRGDPVRRELEHLAAGTDRYAGVDVDVVERAVTLVRRAAAEQPLTLVIDDLQWADPTTVQVWNRLGESVGELPLLLVAAVRSGAPERITGGEVIALGPLEHDPAVALVRAVAATPPEPEDLARILDDAGGHPLYLRLLAASGAGAGSSAELVAAVEAQLSPFTGDTRQVLRAVALLSAYGIRLPGTQPAGCTMGELAAVTDRTVDDLTRALAPVRAGGILAARDGTLAAGDRLWFRHRIVARTLYESTPAPLRVTLCRLYGKRLAAAGAAAERVMGQLLAGEVPLDDALAAWLVEHVERIAEAAPRMAVVALRQAHAQHTLDPARRLVLTAWLARVLLREGQHAAAAAGWVAARTSEPDLAGEMRWTAAYSHERRNEFEAAAEIARTALRERRIAAQWIDRLRLLLGRVRRQLPGNPTEPHLVRSRIMDGEAPLAGSPVTRDR
ncbi:AAA family ATPase [Micromonospora cathayae]|uniref:AAA family ATPase n=1 Tax=Micromonospora cathayae TaxID=3028804 RepID=A0ABY7ZP46_9ACTN|nr:AAA family ATPase [Micromonospora sp. HUAS 3]WDZ83729.1 AAA family ATPase [Micromonospora sp. HUAS 3]